MEKSWKRRREIRDRDVRHVMNPNLNIVLVKLVANVYNIQSFLIAFNTYRLEVRRTKKRLLSFYKTHEMMLSCTSRDIKSAQV